MAVARLGRLAALALTGYLAYLAVRGSRLLVRPIVREFVPWIEGAPSTPGDLGLDWEPIAFRAADGVAIHGWLVRARQPTGATVVLLHGFSGNRLSDLALFVPWLAARFNVVQFDFRGHGESGASHVTHGGREHLDVQAAVDFCRHRGLWPVALYGISMGAAIGIISAPDLPVSAVIADAAYARLRHPIANRLRMGRYPLAWVGSRAILAAATLRARVRLPDPIDRVAVVGPRPLLVIAPRDDALIHYSESIALHAAASEPKELWVVDGAGHGQAVVAGGDAYRERVLGFLERHLGADERHFGAEREPEPATIGRALEAAAYNPADSAQNERDR
jgi:pimeloyl-ACP methyl ester carboxylesterase